jgi:hypothetical protein
MGKRTNQLGCNTCLQHSHSYSQTTQLDLDRLTSDHTQPSLALSCGVTASPCVLG